MSVDRAAMNTRRANITAIGMGFATIVIGASAFPSISSSAATQYERAQSKAQVLIASTQPEQASHDINLWLDDPKNVSSQPHSEISASASLLDETQCMAEAIYYEARSETRSGQKAVGEVILNRIRNKHFPNTVCGVVYEGSERATGCQFTFTCDGSMDIEPKGKAWKRSQDMAAHLLSGGHTPMTHLATHYHTTEVSPKWSGTMRMTRRVGNHVFYRFAPRDYVPSEPTILVAPPI